MASTPPPQPPLKFEYAPPPATRRRMRLRKTRLSIAVLAWLALGLVSLFFGFMTALAQDLPRFEVAQLAQQSNGVIYADDGKTVLGVLRSDQYRVLVHWDEIAPVMRNAIVSIEDKRFFDGWNTRCEPFTWTKTADEILTHTTRKRTSDAEH